MLPARNILLRKGKIYIQEGADQNPQKTRKRRKKQEKTKKKDPNRKGAAQPPLGASLDRVLYELSLESCFLCFFIG